MEPVGRPARGRQRRASFYVRIDPIAQLARRPRGSPFIRTASSGSLASRLAEDARAGVRLRSASPRGARVGAA